MHRINNVQNRYTRYCVSIQQYYVYAHVYVDALTFQRELIAVVNVNSIIQYNRARVSMQNASFVWLILDKALKVYNLFHVTDTSKVKLLLCIFLPFFWVILLVLMIHNI